MNRWIDYNSQNLSDPNRTSGVFRDLKLDWYIGLSYREFFYRIDSVSPLFYEFSLTSQSSWSESEIGPSLATTSWMLHTNRPDPSTKTNPGPSGLNRPRPNRTKPVSELAESNWFSLTNFDRVKPTGLTQIELNWVDLVGMSMHVLLLGRACAWVRSLAHGLTCDVSIWSDAHL